MGNKKNWNNKNNFKLGNDKSLPQSQYFNVLTSSIQITCDIDVSHILNQFKYFVTALQRTHKLNIGSTMKQLTLARLCLFYTGFISVHSSSVVYSLYTNSTFLYFPEFLKPIIDSICCKSHTSNKVNGFTTGELINSKSPLELTIHIRDLSQSQWFNLLQGTDFLDCVSSDKSYEAFQTILASEFYNAGFNSFADQLTVHECEYVSSLLKAISSCFYYNDKVTYYKGALTTYIVNNLIIYRFRNSKRDIHRYFCQQHTLQIGSLSIDILANFLRIFSPSFSTSKTSKIISGDLEISVENVPLDEAWYSYIGFKPESFKRPRPNPGKDTTPLVPNLLQKQAEQLADNIQKREFGTLSYNVGFVTGAVSSGKVLLAFSRQYEVCTPVYFLEGPG